MSKKEEMFELVEQWRGSGLTRKSFAGQHGIRVESFDYWCKKQYNEVIKANRPTTTSRKSQPAMPGFIELTSGLDMNAPSQPVRMEFEFPGGMRIKIY